MDRDFGQPDVEANLMSTSRSLEAKVPPPLLAAVAAAAMWGFSIVLPTLDLPTGIRRGVATALALLAIGISVAGVSSFRRAKTTINPMQPETASTLVSSGIYRFTRNPMYVGLLILLVAWAVFLSSAWALLWPVLFFFYIGRFQIAPEERALAARFGNQFAAYKAKVRRWL
jgi:protein-S-isoprenylcysteine O-methyltransferase Ste14